MNSLTERYIIFTWGCQMNEDDAEQISSMLMRMGMVRTHNPEEADVAILVTCSVREKPEHKAKSKLGELKLIKDQKPDMIIGVCGCMAQRQGAALKKNRPYIDFVVGTHNISTIPALIHNAQQFRKFETSLDLPVKLDNEKPLPGRIERENVGLKCFVPIMYGCDNFCSYCVVPHVRGRERSRDAESILAEILDISDRGCKEVTLLGQNVNSYHDPSGLDFPRLLELVSEVDRIQRIRFITSHPKDLSDNLIAAMADNPKVCEHIHLAVQSGDDRVLQEMNRKYDVKKIKERIAALRSAVPDIAITTDLIVGFPTETQEEFENTIRLVEEIRFDAAFMFAFNTIPGTRAAQMNGHIPTKEKNQRLNQLIKLQNKITCDINNSQIGRIFEVLVEGISPKNQCKATGLTRQSKTVNFEAKDAEPGAIVPVRVTEGHLYGFIGESLVKAEVL